MVESVPSSPHDVPIPSRNVQQNCQSHPSKIAVADHPIDIDAIEDPPAATGQHTLFRPQIPRRLPPTIHRASQISITAFATLAPLSPAGSFLGGFRTPAGARAATSSLPASGTLHQSRHSHRTCATCRALLFQGSFGSAKFLTFPRRLFGIKPFGQKPADVTTHSPVIIGMSVLWPYGNTDNVALLAEVGTNMWEDCHGKVSVSGELCR
jgi:hypothetical protein